MVPLDRDHIWQATGMPARQIASVEAGRMHQDVGGDGVWYITYVAGPGRFVAPPGSFLPQVTWRAPDVLRAGRLWRMIGTDDLTALYW